jgi:hypothetical protein
MCDRTLAQRAYILPSEPFFQATYMELMLTRKSSYLVSFYYFTDAYSTHDFIFLQGDATSLMMTIM